jgi:hypothetical protein
MPVDRKAADSAIAGSAAAADLGPQKAPPPYLPPAPVFTWTGFYVGIDDGFGGGVVKPSCAAIKGDPSLPGGRVNQPQVILIDRPRLD